MTSIACKQFFRIEVLIDGSDIFWNKGKCCRLEASSDVIMPSVPTVIVLPPELESSVDVVWDKTCDLSQGK